MFQNCCWVQSSHHCLLEVMSNCRLYPCSQQSMSLLTKLKHAELTEKGLANIFQAIVVLRVLLMYVLPAYMITQQSQLSQSGRLNLLFRQTHQWQLTGQIYTVLPVYRDSRLAYAVHKRDQPTTNQPTKQQRHPPTHRVQ